MLKKTSDLDLTYLPEEQLVEQGDNVSAAYFSSLPKFGSLRTAGNLAGISVPSLNQSVSI